jgi:hypothetical protein
MSVTVKTFKVKSLSKYGFFADGVEKGVYFSKKLLEADKTRIVPGVSFDGELFTSDSGGLYLNKVTAFHESKKVEKSAEKTVEKAVEKKSFKAKDDTSMSKAEWQAKDRSQLIGGLSHDAAAITAALVAVDTTLVPLDVYKELLEGMLKIRAEVK